ncbi:MAG: HupE/UreJ family protein [Pseudomonadota bacterium]
MAHSRILIGLSAILPLVLTLMLPGIAAAHSGEGVAGGLWSGFVHPILGPDHMIAMIAVGLWGAQLGQPLIIALPLAFPMMMAVGGVLGVLGVPLPQVELGIAVSALLLGLLVAFAFRAPVWLAVVLVGAFALFHGHAHGTELPAAASAIAYGIGFVIATGLLHALGIAIGLLHDWKSTGPAIVRGCGGVIAAVGAWYVMGALSVV